MENFSFLTVLRIVALTLGIVVCIKLITNMSKTAAPQGDYVYVRDTMVYDPPEVMYNEIRYLDGTPIDTTNVWRRDVSAVDH